MVLRVIWAAHLLVALMIGHWLYWCLLLFVCTSFVSVYRNYSA